MPPVSNFRMRLQATVACAGGLVIWWRFGGTAPALLAGVFASLALLAWTAPGRYRPVQRVFDFLVGQFVKGFSWLMLGLVYFFIFMPLRVLWVLTGRDPLRLRPLGGAKSYFQTLPPAGKGRFERQF